MSRAIESSVLIVGAGPVGLTLALDLAWRGIDVTVAELRAAGASSSVKCNQVSARSMEIFRRLGIAGEIRSMGLPDDYPHDVVSCVTVTGAELSRLVLPSREGRRTNAEGADTWWPTPEPTHRINQIYLEAALFAYAAAQPRIRILNRTLVEHIAQDEHGVTASACNLDSGEQISIHCRYLAGCDGSKSIIRKAIGAKFSGIREIQRTQSTHIHAPGLIKLLPGKPAWMYRALNPRRCGFIIAIDGIEKWIVHNWLYPGEADFDAIDRDWAIRTILGVGSKFRYEVIAKEDWIGRRLVADRFRDRRVFICGDAAHLWTPQAGYGMNAGIADATNLSWKIAAALNGWAAPQIVDSYEAERQPLTDQVSRLAMKMAFRVTEQRGTLPADMEMVGSVGDSLRKQIGKEAYTLDAEQQCCGGLNFGYFYDDSPIIAYDGEAQPEYTMGAFASSTVPGCRAPHLWLDDGRSLYDALGPNYTLLRIDPKAGFTRFAATAEDLGFPLTVLAVKAADSYAAYRHRLVLVRPDQHVAWRGDKEPENPSELISLVSGGPSAHRDAARPGGFSDQQT